MPDNRTKRIDLDHPTFGLKEISQQGVIRGRKQSGHYAAACGVLADTIFEKCGHANS